MNVNTTLYTALFYVTTHSKGLLQINENLPESSSQTEQGIDAYQQ